ncbi:MAG: prolipoprotein diacylglyceryl transferase [Burkholderiales bacterium]|nr:prolipoprotein diacylglyceryl transferase [Burkholderiales bacterium]
MLMYPKIDPVAFSLGKLKVHWYGIMYMVGFLSFLYIGKYRVKKYGHSFLTVKLVDDTLFYAALGVVLGGRLGYCLFYQPMFYLLHPLNIIKTWDGGMSFHGGLLGVMLATYLFARKNNSTFFELSDFIAPIVPVALFFGRIGNFINGELWGKITTAGIPWAMVFPQSGTMLPRHPSQLYEALGEGIILATFLLIYSGKPRKIGQTSAMFLIGYGIIRFVIEYFREPDSFLRNVVQMTHLSMGQWLCVPMILLGIVLYYYSTKYGRYMVIKPQPDEVKLDTKHR